MLKERLPPIPAIVYANRSSDKAGQRVWFPAGMDGRNDRCMAGRALIQTRRLVSLILPNYTQLEIVDRRTHVFALSSAAAVSAVQ